MNTNQRDENLEKLFKKAFDQPEIDSSINAVREPIDPNDKVFQKLQAALEKRIAEKEDTQPTATIPNSSLTVIQKLAAWLDELPNWTRPALAAVVFASFGLVFYNLIAPSVAEKIVALNKQFESNSATLTVTALDAETFLSEIRQAGAVVQEIEDTEYVYLEIAAVGENSKQPNEVIGKYRLTVDKTKRSLLRIKKNFPRKG